MENLLTLNNIHFNYKNTKALCGIDLKIDHGIFGLLGPNGAGKTTLMKIILGFLSPSQGNGNVLGFDILSDFLKIRQQIGYMPETDCLIPGMDGVSITAYLGELSGMPKEEAMKRAHEVLYYVGLEEARYRKADTYSSGMKQRLKLATALVHDPSLLFLDEPTSGMDPNSRREVLDLIKDISNKKNMDIIISSHILSDIEYTCDTALIMDKGKIVSTKLISDIDSSNLDKIGVSTKDKVSKTKELNVFEIKVKGDIEILTEDIKDIKIRKDNKGNTQLLFPQTFDTTEIFRHSILKGVQIRHFKKQRATLEDTFVSAIGNSSTNQSNIDRSLTGESNAN